jgi:chromate transporter
MLGLARLYFQVDLTQAGVGAALLGVQVAVVALIVRASERIGRHVLIAPGLWLIAIAAAVATVAGVPFWIALPVAGLVSVVAARVPAGPWWLAAYGVALAAAFLAFAWVAATTGVHLATTAGGAHVAGAASGAPSTIPNIFLSGLKAGLLTFGGAYTAIPFIRADAVGNGWLTDAQFLDGLALGGVLPAPLIIFGTFVGYVAGGLSGAIAMTLGIFIPAFSFALVLGDRIEAVVERPALHRLLEGVAAGVVGIIVVTAFDLGAAVAARVPSFPLAAAIFLAALVVFFRWRARAAIPVVLGAAALTGWIASVAR